MRISVEGEVVAVLDRKLVAMTPTYDIYRGSEKMGWIEKVVAFRDTFDVYLEGAGGMLGRFQSLSSPSSTWNGCCIGDRLSLRYR